MKEIGMDYSSPDGYKLIPTCEWFQNLGAITGAEVEEIRRIRDHRNKIAHELHLILYSGETSINMDYFVRITELLRQIELYWFKNGEPLFDFEMGDVVNPDNIADDDFVSGREAALRMITKSAFDHLAKFEK